MTPRQRDVLRVLAAAPANGLMAWQVRDRIYPADSPMRTRRTRGRERSGAVGGLGNLAAGRILSGLARQWLADQPGMFDRPYPNFRWAITEKGRRLLAEETDP